MPQLFAQKTALVTGASSGVGQAIATALAAQGCGLCLVGRRKDRLSALADQLRPQAGFVSVVPADLAVASEVARLAQAVAVQPGRLDFLIHCAGQITWAPLEKAQPEEMEQQWRCNVLAPSLLTRGLLPLLRQSRGQIVFINSTVGLQAKANVAAYSATKHALKGFADALRDEVNADGIRVLSLFLGRTNTPMQEDLARIQGVAHHGERLLQPGDVAQVLLPLLHLPATAEVTELVLRPLAK